MVISGYNKLMTPKPKPEEEFITVSIRFPKRLYDWLNNKRKADNRSFNQQVIWLLSRFYHEDKTQEGK